MTIKRKVVKRSNKKNIVVKRRPNPEKSKAYEMGYRIGKDDIKQNQWSTHDIVQGYFANIEYLLDHNKFDKSLSNYQYWMLGYIQAKIDQKNDIKYQELYYNIKNDKNYYNPLLEQHSHAMWLINQGAGVVKGDSLSFINKNKIPWNKINNLIIRLNGGDAFGNFIINNLLKFKYIRISPDKYEYIFTEKGEDFIHSLQYLGVKKLEPENYGLMKDIQDYLSK